MRAPTHEYIEYEEVTHIFLIFPHRQRATFRARMTRNAVVVIKHIDVCLAPVIWIPKQDHCTKHETFGTLELDA